MKIGDLVKISFWDHCKAIPGNAQPIECTVFGRVGEKTKLFVRIDSWNASEEEVETYSENRDSYAIIRSTIKKVRKLK